MSQRKGDLLPIIGRHVHYVSYGSADGTYPSVCRVAIVTEVKDMVDDGYGGNLQNTEHVGLCVLNPTGMFFSRDLPYADPREMKGGTWHWPCVKPDVTPDEGVSIAVPQGKTMNLGSDEGMGPVTSFEPGEVRFNHHGRMLSVVFGLRDGHPPVAVRPVRVQDLGPAD